jgi:polysaccharide deacetylase family protein (PEP-CTERM system associated)
MTQGVTFTLDLEDHLESYAPDGRWVKNSHAILDWTAEKKIAATFFAVGRAAAAPELLRRIVQEGHELALHSWDHIHLTKEDPASYGAKLDAAKKQFEDLTGAAVTGFRAPQFSLTPQSRWAVDTLKTLGFTYSSSIIPGKGLFHGFPDKPAIPFQWENGLWEFPVPVVQAGSLTLPFLGGIYLRYLPLALVRHWQKKQPEGAVLWTYLHPYDIDADEGFVRLQDGTPFWANLLLMQNRKGFLDKLAALLDGQSAPLLRERVPAN